MSNLFENNIICYSEDVLEILHGTPRNAVDEVNGNYGIEMTLDINQVPIVITIPQVSLIFGQSAQYLQHFTCT